MKLIKRDINDNLYSQWGEEAAIRELLKIVDLGPGFVRDKELTKILVEFGGSCGSDHSNFFRFMESGIKLIMIEGDRDRFRRLELTANGHPSLIAINEWVDDNKNSVSEILRRHGVSDYHITGVSIDIDGDDARIFENLGVEPSFVIIEHNPTLPIDGRYRNPKGKHVGNSLGELVAVANQRDMYPVCLTETNIIFLKNSYRTDVREIDIVHELSSLNLMRFGMGFDGTLVRFTTSGQDATAEFYHNGWANSFIVQPLPQVLRLPTSSRFLLNLRLLYSITITFLLRPFSFTRFLLRFLKIKHEQGALEHFDSDRVVHSNCDNN